MYDSLNENSRKGNFIETKSRSIVTYVGWRVRSDRVCFPFRVAKCSNWVVVLAVEIGGSTRGESTGNESRRDVLLVKHLPLQLEGLSLAPRVKAGHGVCL